MFKFTIKAYDYDNDSNTYYYGAYMSSNDYFNNNLLNNAVIITVRALSESEAVDKCKDLIDRKYYEVIEIMEE
jgi:type IV secretory pathway TrbF-like protein